MIQLNSSLAQNEDYPSAFSLSSDCTSLHFALGDILRKKKGFAVNVNQFSSCYGRRFLFHPLIECNFHEKENERREKTMERLPEN